MDLGIELLDNMVPTYMNAAFIEFKNKVTNILQGDEKEKNLNQAKFLKIYDSLVLEGKPEFNSAA